MSTVSAGTALFRPPRGPRNTVVYCCCFFPFTYSFLIKAGFLETDFHYTTIFWIFATYRFSHNFLLRVSFSPAPECVDRVCWNRSFSTPPAGPGTPLLLVVVFPFYLFLFNKGWFSGNRFSLHNDILNLRHLPFFPQLFVEGLLFSRPWVCRPCLLEPLFFDPPAGPGTPLCYCCIFPFYLFLFNKGWFSGNRFSLHNDILNLRHLPFFPQLFVEGLLFSRPWVCRPCLLEPLFFDPPAGPGTPLLVVVFFPFYLFLFNKGWFSGNRFSLHNDILNLRHLPFFPQLFVEGLLFSRPWVCRPCLLEPLFFDPPAGPGTPLLLVVCFSLLPIPF